MCRCLSTSLYRNAPRRARRQHGAALSSSEAVDRGHGVDRAPPTSEQADDDAHGEPITMKLSAGADREIKPERQLDESSTTITGAASRTPTTKTIAEHVARRDATSDCVRRRRRRSAAPHTTPPARAAAVMRR